MLATHYGSIPVADALPARKRRPVAVIVGLLTGMSCMILAIALVSVLDTQESSSSETALIYSPELPRPEFDDVVRSEESGNSIRKRKLAPAPHAKKSPASTSLGAIIKKKGFAYGYKNNAIFATQMQSLNLGWYYSWGLKPYDGTLDIPFTPMVWGAPDASKLDKIPTGATELLAFNEPDLGKQSNVTISQVVSLWPALKKTGLRIGSVATASNPMGQSYTPTDGSAALNTSYFDALWQKLDAAGNTPDFIALHWYAPPHADSFLSWLDKIHDKYKKPIWVTEMCVADWNAGKPGYAAFETYTTEEIQAFMDKVVAGMNSRDFVERFAWKTRSTSDVNLGNGALFKDDGSLTALGQHYASL